MTKYSDITVQLGNFNGFRNKIGNQGRLEITLESLLSTCPVIRELNVLLMDNNSTDGSQDYLFSLPFGKKISVPRLVIKTGWEATTVNNMDLLKKAILLTETEYLWRIENDSYFYNKTNFIERTMEVLENDSEISIIHLRRWTELDAKDMPAVGRNINRIEAIRESISGFRYYVMQKLEQELIWVPLKEDLGKDYVPDNEEGYGKCPLGRKVVGAVQLNDYGKYERLLNEHWNSYTNHGWIAKTRDLKFIVSKYDPKNEREFSKCFKKHFKAGKIDQDAFVAFGWRTKGNFSEKEILNVFNFVEKNNYSSIKDYGLLNYEPPN